MSENKRLVIDGKEVRIFLFARLTHLIQNGAIPVDRKKRSEIFKATDQQKFIVQVQVEGFTVDHALERLQNELYPFVKRAEWELIDELDPTHDIGLMGAKHPLVPAATSKKNLH